MPEPSLVRRGGFPSTRARRRSAHRLCRPPGSRFDPTRREELLHPVTNADLAVLCGADTWGETALLGGREEARPPTFLAMPREIFRRAAVASATLVVAEDEVEHLKLGVLDRLMAAYGRQKTRRSASELAQSSGVGVNRSGRDRDEATDFG